MSTTSKKLSATEQKNLIELLKKRFDKNTFLHPKTKWFDVQSKLEKSPSKLWSLQEMEDTGGEPDVVDLGVKKGEIVFVDCSKESPKGRRSLCYDGAALKSRKEHKPAGSAVEMAKAMGVELLTNEEYWNLQQLGEFDLKTSSWVLTPPAIRKLKGAIFCDRRYDTVFTYHNGAESYYAARGFRTKLIL